ncbi:MAG: helicase-related protein [Pirellulaceae bacterium]
MPSKAVKYRCSSLLISPRGIDIDGITHVVNYDMPVDAESYVHRIGRTGRAGADGIALSFCSAAEMGELREIEQLIGKKIPLAPGQVAPRPAPPERRKRGSPGQASGQSTSRGGSRSHARSQNNTRSSGPRSGQATSQRSASNRSSRSSAHDREVREQRSSDSPKPSPLPRKPAAMATSGATASSFAGSLNDSASAQPRAKRPLQRSSAGCRVARLACGRIDWTEPSSISHWGRWLPIGRSIYLITSSDGALPSPKIKIPLPNASVKWKNDSRLKRSELREERKNALEPVAEAVVVDDDSNDDDPNDDDVAKD